ncbi:ribosomal-protein-alanine N-acetyltransferase [Seongchinamella unica]|uniref:[Ribosomal protein bS18]-alanine N-acetyltransferase n=1 Tax=Seongchinamella unica TaxID=2547392 RepID=A0A4R5LPF5_9GAMM|nr:ribosomal protein S18-alanine N-acetyltransferase [Seongchinamella unica]TDG12180.1 ribosomal-protein-alanine N-acetyltransferase [Seongchinamella unica]
MALDRAVSASPWSEQVLAPYLRSSSADTHVALVLEVAGELAGFLFYTRLLDEANIDNLAVAQDHQGKGCATALLAAGLREMSAGGLVRCLLEVRKSNVAARALYENNGFVVDGIRPRYYKTARGREDALLMSRRL